MRTVLRMAARAPGRAALAAIALAMFAGTANAQYAGPRPTVRAERAYFHCTGPTKVANVDLVLSGPTSWDTTAPSQSVADGAGCGAVDPGALRGANPATIYDAVFRGPFTGNLRDLTLELHNLALSRARTTADFAVRVRMLIDGVQIFPETAGVQVNVTPELSSTGASEKFLISVPALGCSREIFDQEGNLIAVITDGFVSEDGDGVSEHDIQLAIDSWFTDRASAWVWDTTEVPSGITFNPTGALATAKANPTDPADCGSL